MTRRQSTTSSMQGFMLLLLTGGVVWAGMLLMLQRTESRPIPLKMRFHSGTSLPVNVNQKEAEFDDPPWIPTCVNREGSWVVDWSVWQQSETSAETD